jgi:hypothetical protein
MLDSTLGGIIFTASVLYIAFLFCRGLFLAIFDGFTEICRYDKTRKGE